MITTNLITAINQLSYGIVGTHLNTELQKLGIEVALFPINSVEYNTHPKHHPYLKSGLENSHKYDKLAPCVRIWHQFDLARFVGKGKHIGFPIFELDTFTDVEKHHLNQCDELFVCSQWAKDIIKRNNITPKTTIIPLGVDAEIFKPVVSQHPSTVFLNIGKFEKRKGHDILPEIFKRAFPGDENVELWMMSYNPFPQVNNSEWQEKYQKILGNKVHFINQQPTQEHVASIIQLADCGIFPSRGEGWNLPALEMLSCGKQIVATNYSAHTEFLNKDNASLVLPETTESASDGIWFHGQGNWASLGDTQISEFSEKIRKIYLDKQAGKDIINREGVETAHYFSWEHSAEKLIGALNE